MPDKLVKLDSVLSWMEGEYERAKKNGDTVARGYIYCLIQNVYLPTNYLNMKLLEALINLLKTKNTGEEVAAPEGVCPNCWGKQEWDGEYYKFKKGEKGNPSTATYNSFIQDVARKLDKITINKNTYTCQTCKVEHKL